LIANFILSSTAVQIQDNIKWLFIRFTVMPVIKFILWISFIAFLILLTKNILFKKSPGYYKNNFTKDFRHYSVKQGWEKSNTKPFSTIKLFYNSRNLNSEYKQNNLLGNLLGFVPVGFLLAFLIPFFRKGIYVLMAGFSLSLCFEMTQLVFDLGIFDVDDILLNTTGCFTGYVIYWFVNRIFPLRNETHK
jgi:glycopeptide antibiotics resistance protein